MRIFTIAFLLIVIVYPNYSYSQIVNMESARKENLLGTHYELNFGLNGSSGTIDRTNYSLEGRIDLNSEKWKRFAIVSYKREEKDSSITSNDTFMHIRGVRKINPLLALEGFIQINEKPLQKIKRRELIGAGIRLSPYKSVRIGLGIFNENEERIFSEARETVRINSYVTNSFKISENASFDSTLYLQPDIEDFSELRSYIILSLRLKISKRFSSIISYENTHDTSPPPMTDKSNSSYGIKFSFEY